MKLNWNTQIMFHIHTQNEWIAINNQYGSLAKQKKLALRAIFNLSLCELLLSSFIIVSNLSF